MEERESFEDRTAWRDDARKFSVGLSIDVYVRRRIFEWPDIRKCYRVRN